ncbi:homoserine kinase [Leptospirillum ferrooxidans]|uniref:Homoserine kinase n=1 Tax=Leptospirillum ferrooxidans (strain C2-3) TaxID=1162668 RepID=I0IM78_LEPFC|nr:homoserine kinase [Leptospirillum ferrooxidans]BAM06377.1 putative homoserine kinase [Leptospirillum ferrooxidans C2-3]
MRNINMNPVTVYAPASVGNIGPGFDTLGMAVTGMGDQITGYLEDKRSGDRILSISGAWSELPMDPNQNTATIAARTILDMAGLTGKDLVISIEKGVPGSGLGSSAASAVGGAFLGNILAGNPFSEQEVLEAAANAESRVSGGYFLDNVSACLYGGVTVSITNLKKSFRFGSLDGVHLLFIVPRSLLKTSESRKAIPEKVPFKNSVEAIMRTAGILTAVSSHNQNLFCEMVNDPLVSPYRGPLIPLFSAIRDIAVEAGASNLVISGAGSTMVALSPNQTTIQKVQDTLQPFLDNQEYSAVLIPSTIDSKGARIVNRTSSL